MHFKIVELSPIPHEGKTADAVVLVARDFTSYEDAKLALLGYEAESAHNNEWDVYAVLAMTSDFPI